MTICPNCGSENPEYAFYCGKCATELKDASGKPYVKRRPSKPPPAQKEEPKIAELRKPVQTVNPAIGGICVIIAGALAAVQGGFLLLGEALATYVSGDVFLSAGFWGAGFIAVGLAAILLGLRAVNRISYTGALIGAVLGIVGMGLYIGPFLALAGLLLIALSREEFEP
jgi:uncharacterized protein YqgC (DUF456 family)